jgi:hypothetical protein
MHSKHTSSGISGSGKRYRRLRTQKCNSSGSGILMLHPLALFALGGIPLDAACDALSLQGLRRLVQPMRTPSAIVVAAVATKRDAAVLEYRMLNNDVLLDA